MNSESGQPEPIPGCSSASAEPNNIEDDPEIEVLKNQFFAENPNLAKLTWEGAEASVKAESVNNFKFDNTFDDDDFVSEAGGNIVL